jgi:hypothetical protein
MFNYGKDATQNYQCLNTCACYHTTLCAYIQTQIEKSRSSSRRSSSTTTTTTTTTITTTYTSTIDMCKNG